MNSIEIRSKQICRFFNHKDNQSIDCMICIILYSKFAILSKKIFTNFMQRDKYIVYIKKATITTTRLVHLLDCYNVGSRQKTNYIFKQANTKYGLIVFIIFNQHHTQSNTKLLILVLNWLRCSFSFSGVINCDLNVGAFRLVPPIKNFKFTK